MTTARVIGAGLSGLATAWCLVDAGFDVELVEAASEPGGLIRSRHTPHGLVESAANAFTWNDTVAGWFARLDLDPRPPLPANRRRFIFRNGRPRRWPLTLGESATVGLRLGTNVIRRRARPAGDETVAAWGDRVLGRAATTWLVEPALQGIYGAPANRLAARAIFGRDGRRRGRTGRRSRSRGPSLVAPADGMGAFVARLAERLAARSATFTYGVPATVLDPAIPTAVCTDAPAAAALIAPHAPALADAIRAVPMNALVPATAFFEPHHSDTRGFGVLFPRASGVSALGVLFNADIFDGRSALRAETWIYGFDATRTLPTEIDLAATLARDRERLTRRSATPIALVIGGREHAPTNDVVRAAWLPVYDASVLRVADRLADLPPWLALAGNYTGRLGVAKLLDVAAEAAERLRPRASLPTSS